MHCVIRQEATWRLPWSAQVPQSTLQAWCCQCHDPWLHCGITQPLSVGPLGLVGVNLLPLVPNSGEILELSKGEKVPVAAFVTRLRLQQRERMLKMN